MDQIISRRQDWVDSSESAGIINLQISTHSKYNQENMNSAEFSNSKSHIHITH
jgi:hypothetical protein